MKLDLTEPQLIRVIRAVSRAECFAGEQESAVVRRALDRLERALHDHYREKSDDNIQQVGRKTKRGPYKRRDR